MPGRRLSREERLEIEKGWGWRWTLGDIAADIGGPVSTVAREVAREGGREIPSGTRPSQEPGGGPVPALLGRVRQALRKAGIRHQGVERASVLSLA